MRKSPSPLHRVNLRDRTLYPAPPWRPESLHPLFIGSTLGTWAQLLRWYATGESPSPLHRVNLRDGARGGLQDGGSRVSIPSSSGQPSGHSNRSSCEGRLLCLHPLFIGSTFGTLDRVVSEVQRMPVSIPSSSGQPSGLPTSVFANYHCYRLHPLFIGSTFGTLQYGFQIRFARQMTNLTISPFLSPQCTQKSNRVRAYETQFSRSLSSCEAHARCMSQSR